MSFPANAQQETNRKILEDLQLKKQLLQKSITAGVSQGTSTAVAISEFGQVSGIGISGGRVAGSSSSTAPFGSFITQDSYYGNSFIPVLPRLEPLQPPPTTLPSTSAAAVAAAAAAAVNCGPSTSAAAAAAAAASLGSAPLAK